MASRLTVRRRMKGLSDVGGVKERQCCPAGAGGIILDERRTVTGGMQVANVRQELSTSLRLL
jgi:hypothetical protein